jgi:hypothetical protein
MAKSAKEKCFEDAWGKYKDTFQEKTDVKMQRPWGQRTNGQWDNNYNSWQHALNSFMSWMRGGGGSTTQMRIPDLTINQGGRTSVLDLKFTRGNGTVDDWGQRPGAGNGQLQRQDYNDINRQQNGGQSQYGDDPKLDADKCGCNKPNGTATAPVTVNVSQLAFDGSPGIYVMPGPLAPGVSLPPVNIPSLPPMGIPGLGPRLLPGLRP